MALPCGLTVWAAGQIGQDGVANQPWRAVRSCATCATVKKCYALCGHGKPEGLTVFAGILESPP